MLRWDGIVLQVKSRLYLVGLDRSHVNYVIYKILYYNLIP